MNIHSCLLDFRFIYKAYYLIVHFSIRFLSMICTKNPLPENPEEGSLRAIDGARTRGLDLGKVARYQLRHYRINSVLM